MTSLDQNSTFDGNTEGTETIQVTSDTGTLLRALSKTFTNDHAVLGELLQNGRRAGASRIDITVTDDLIVVQDDGCGISDFSVLLSIAKSGWDDAVKRSDAPYGMGFASSFFTCEHLGVMSKGKHVYASTNDLIDLKPVPVNETADLGVTEIRLHGHRLGREQEVVARLGKLAKGFPIPVIVNGKDLPRPDAIGIRELIPTPIGLVSPDLRIYTGQIQFYLQGLPIHAHASGPRSWGKWNSSDNARVVHLNSPQFEGRLPERDSLLNPEQSHKAIYEALRQLAIDFVTAESIRMEPKAFIKAYAEVAKQLDMRDLLNSIDYIPTSWVWQFVDVPTYTPSGWDPEFSGPAMIGGETVDVLSRDDLSNGRLVLLEEFDEEGSDLLAAHAVRGMGAVVVQQIPDWHWASALAVEVSSEDFELVVGKELGSQMFEFWCYSMTVVLVDTLKARTKSALRGEIEQVGIPVYYDSEAKKLYITENCYTQDAVRNVCNFTSDDEHDEQAEDSATTDLDVIIRSLKDADPADLLQSVLARYMPLSMPDSLKGKTFQLTLNEHGRPIVTLA